MYDGAFLRADFAKFEVELPAIRGLLVRGGAPIEDGAFEAWKAMADLDGSNALFFEYVRVETNAESAGLVKDR